MQTFPRSVLFCFSNNKCCRVLNFFIFFFEGVIKGFIMNYVCKVQIILRKVYSLVILFCCIYYFLVICSLKPRLLCVQKVCTIHPPLPTIDNLPSPNMAITPFLSFFQTPYFWQDFCDNITPMKQIFIFRRLKNNGTCLFIKNTFTSNTRLRFNPK